MGSSQCGSVGMAVIGAFPGSFGGVTRSQLIKWNFLLLLTNKRLDPWIYVSIILYFSIFYYYIVHYLFVKDKCHPEQMKTGFQIIVL